MIHFELISYRATTMNQGWFFFFNIGMFKCSSTIYWKYILSPLNYLVTFVENQLTTYVGIYFWTLFCSIDLYVYPFTNTISSYFCSFILSLKIRYCEPSNLVFFLNNALTSLPPLLFHTHFGISLPIYAIKLAGVLLTLYLIYLR